MSTFSHTLIFIMLHAFLSAQPVKPGFDRDECRELLAISAATARDEAYAEKLPYPERFEKVYEGKVTALGNSWDLWMDEGAVVAVSIRGAALPPDISPENFFAPMLPAAGEITLDTAGAVFRYRLADDPRAAVHAGWLIGTALLSQEIVPQVKALCEGGVRDLLITGHGEGGAMAYLLTAHLLRLRESGDLPADLRIKTYCIAAPKPGNPGFAHSFEAATRDGYAFNVVNANDPVPQMPLTVQTLDDFTAGNLFSGAPEAVGENKLSQKRISKRTHRKLSKPLQKARNNYLRHLSDPTLTDITKKLPGLQLPPAESTAHYVRTGHTITLLPDAAYREMFRDGSGTVHHLHASYFHLLDAAYYTSEEIAAREEKSPFFGSPTWVLIGIDGFPAESMKQEDPPTLRVEEETGLVKGFGGCNEFSAKGVRKGKEINIGPVAASRKHCGKKNIENAYLPALEGVFRIEVKDNFLRMKRSDGKLLTFIKAPAE